MTTTDPAVELAARYMQGVDDFNASTGKTDEEVEAFDKGWQTPLERELAKVHPTSREGVAALIDLVLREERQQHGGDAGGYVIGMLENARTALRGMAGLAGEAADPQREKKKQVDAKIAAGAPADLWRRWQEIREEFPQGPPNETAADEELRQGLLGDEAGAIEHKILHTPARNVAEVLVKMQLAEGLIQMCARDEPQHQEETAMTEDRLMVAAYTDLKRLLGQDEANVA